MSAICCYDDVYEVDKILRGHDNRLSANLSRDGCQHRVASTRNRSEVSREGSDCSAGIKSSTKLIRCKHTRASQCAPCSILTRNMGRFQLAHNCVRDVGIIIQAQMVYMNNRMHCPPELRVSQRRSVPNLGMIISCTHPVDPSTTELIQLKRTQPRIP